ncbi:hypothetical protein JIN85_06690 [Luteolibacter pohnpeiensis]|uniref:Uncharacterized protein n=1 Tax=Luteolibacter pohnpeiensis TaxID=454153 RepID=A0A934SB58_9BACT|nr:hypothetical protein [Luteolibacter pohnpeiensis]
MGAAADETGDELKLPEAKQGTKSLNQLTAELQRLEKELLDLASSPIFGVDPVI